MLFNRELYFFQVVFAIVTSTVVNLKKAMRPSSIKLYFYQNERTKQPQKT